ncbi:MAG: nodulation protein S NodS [Methanobacteriota archaeon]|nr:MAG: nodulation protein S NodS [Euryarchaeota archaeon]
MRKAIDVFGEWAEKGKDQGMEESHAIAVDEMMNFALKERLEIGKKFSFLDLGCGNGWVVRKVANNTLCNLSVGIDGAQQMISNAELRGGDKYDVIHSMEVLYYLDDPSEIVRKISDSWLNKNGRLIVGIDHYYENTDSHSWQEKVGTRMLMLREIEWIQIFEDAGLSEVESWHSNKHTDWAGTLVITGKKQII